MLTCGPVATMPGGGGKLIRSQNLNGFKSFQTLTNPKRTFPSSKKLK
jgi:hypothetical protein